MSKAVMFDCYNTLLRYESEEEKAGIWKMMKEAIEYTTGMKLLLLSNAQNCFIYNELPVEIRKMFDVVIISEEVGIKKPAPEVFGLAFEKLDMKPEDTVFVGDSLEDDMIPSGKLGCYCIMIGKEEKKTPELSHVIHFNPYKESGYTGLAENIAAI